MDERIHLRSNINLRTSGKYEIVNHFLWRSRTFSTRESSVIAVGIYVLLIITLLSAFSRYRFGDEQLHIPQHHNCSMAMLFSAFAPSGSVLLLFFLYM
jgi:hypothetical protein